MAEEKRVVMYLARLEAVKPAKPGQYKPGQAKPEVLALFGFWPGLRSARAGPSRQSRGFQRTMISSLNYDGKSSKRDVNDQLYGWKDR